MDVQISSQTRRQDFRVIKCNNLQRCGAVRAVLHTMIYGVIAWEKMSVLGEICAVAVIEKPRGFKQVNFIRELPKVNVLCVR